MYIVIYFYVKNTQYNTIVPMGIICSFFFSQLNATSPQIQTIKKNETKNNET